MKERPILFQGAMVRAILDYVKTQTRRLVKPGAGIQRKWLSEAGINSSPRLNTCFTDKGIFGARMEHPGGGPLGFVTCPYGQPGDRLWVRETVMDLTGTGVEHRDKSGKRQRYAYGADSPPGSYGDQARKDYGLKWTPSIHMPRAASRILLEIVSVRVERLQDISQDDARVEGIKSRVVRAGITPAPVTVYGLGTDNDWCSSAVDAYRELWESINGAGSWDVNPWVWVVEFKRVLP